MNSYEIRGLIFGNLKNAYLLPETRNERIFNEFYLCTSLKYIEMSIYKIKVCNKTVTNRVW